MFRFKQFQVEDSRSAMKIGTDAVLLGAWCPVDATTKTILDIGAGTGILSLMLAQRSLAMQIDAIEIEEAAYEECVENFENSIWRDRLYCYHAGLDEFMDEPETDYDLIVCNPPFFEENVKTDNPARNLARFQDAMPFEDLVDAADLLLSEKGTLAVVIPFEQEARFLELGAAVELYPVQVTRVRGSHSTPIVRSLLALQRYEIPVVTATTITIEINRHEYTDEYIGLTKDFYLKM